MENLASRNWPRLPFISRTSFRRVLGATGQVGHALARKLSQAGHQLTIMVRKAAGQQLPEPSSNIFIALSLVRRTIVFDRLVRLLARIHRADPAMLISENGVTFAVAKGLAVWRKLIQIGRVSLLGRSRCGGAEQLRLDRQLANLFAHRLADIGGEAIVEAGKDARLGHLVVVVLQMLPPAGHA